VPGPSWARPKALILKEIDSAAGVLSATQQIDSQHSAAELFAEGDNVKADVKGDDSFVLRNVESILLESPEERENQRRSLFGNAKSATTNKLDISKDPLVNELRVMREMLTNIPDIWTYMNILVPDKKAIYDEHLCDSVVDLSYHQVYDAVHRAAGAFQALGIKRGDHVAVFGENSAHWLFADQGVMRLGGATVVRGADAPVEELRYIYDNADAREVVGEFRFSAVINMVVVERHYILAHAIFFFICLPVTLILQGPTLLRKMAKAAERDGLEGIGLCNKHGPASTIVLLHREDLDDADIGSLSSSLGIRVLCLADIMNNSKPVSVSALPSLTSDTLATIVYTSGTTGRPKGVMLSHGNLGD